MSAPSWDRLPVVIISCQVLQDLFGRLLSEGLVREIRLEDFLRDMRAGKG